MHRILWLVCIMAIGCGDDGASIASACEHDCECRCNVLDPEVYCGHASAEACTVDCEQEAPAANPSQACIDCVVDADCQELGDGTACETECRGSSSD